MGFRQKIRNLKDCRDSSSIYDVYYNEWIDENLIYFESRNGRDFAGNIMRVIEEISSGSYGDFEIHVFANDNVKDKISEFKKNYDLKIDKIITDPTKACMSLERAKYIFTDSGIQFKYVKRQGQVFVDLWHGTPLKMMGVDNVTETLHLGHIQHPLLSSDYLLYPSEYMMDIMLRAYHIDRIYPGNVILEGYPRNAVFFDESRRLEMKDILGYGDNDVFVYMPTYRGPVQEIDSTQKDVIEAYLDEIDDKLTENQVLIVKLHPYDESRIDFKKYDNVMPFPSGFEIYDVINIADCLITDYSSVLFDYANTKGKIILFNYDEVEYLESRGVYIPLDELPFPKVQNVSDLVTELNLPKGYDDSEFLERFCRYDSIDATERLCQHILNNNKICTERQIKTDRKNVLIHCTNSKNWPILFDMINDDYNYFLCYSQWSGDFRQNYRKLLEKLPENVELLPLRYNLTPTFDEKKDYNMYFASKDMECPDSIKRLFERSFDKQFQNLDFSAVIDFDATDANVSSMFALSNSNSAIWLHDDTFEKMNSNILKNILPKFDIVAADSSKLSKKASEISKKDIKESVEDILF